MDIRQAAHGLNICSASRVFFVSPPLRPDIEAQAIKRAHRIGQTKPVHVETLILAGTIEESMHDRAAAMTRREHLEAKSLEDDQGIRGILQNARILPFTESEASMLRGSIGVECLSPLHQPEQIFGRPGRGNVNGSALENELFGHLVAENKTPRKRSKASAGDTPTKKRKSSVKTPKAKMSAVAATDSSTSAVASLFGGGTAG